MAAPARAEAARDGAMALFAAGFNAWNQLRPRAADPDPDPDRGEPDDLFAFEKVLEGRCVRPPLARLSCTLVWCDGVLVHAGAGIADGGGGGCGCGNGDVPPAAARVVAEAVNGEILALEHDATSAPSGHGDGDATPKVLARYASARAFASRDRLASWRCKSPVQAVAAFAAGFAVLYGDGTVATLGDARFPDCLARPVTQDSPADEPALVPDLASLGDAVTHVAAAGYALAALTESGSVYAWGMTPTGTHRRHLYVPGLCSTPNYVDVDGGKDVCDVALGDSHAIALTADGCVYVLGENSNGQLGLGPSTECVRAWTKAALALPDQHHVVAVAAGPRSSFILTRRHSTPQGPQTQAA